MVLCTEIYCTIMYFIKIRSWFLFLSQLNITFHSFCLAVTPDSIFVRSSNATSLEVAWQPSKVYKVT